MNIRPNDVDGIDAHTPGVVVVVSLTSQASQQGLEDNMALMCQMRWRARLMQRKHCQLIISAIVMQLFVVMHTKAWTMFFEVI